MRYTAVVLLESPLEVTETQHSGSKTMRGKRTDVEIQIAIVGAAIAIRHHMRRNDTGTAFV